MSGFMDFVDRVCRAPESRAAGLRRPSASAITPSPVRGGAPRPAPRRSAPEVSPSPAQRGRGLGGGGPVGRSPMPFAEPRSRRQRTSPRVFWGRCEPEPAEGARRARRHERNSPRRAGFTLIEVIVALVVSGVVAAAGYGVLAGTADGRAAVAREREARLPGPAVRGALDGWLRSAALWEGSGPFRGRDRRIGPLPVDELSFTVDDGGALYPGRRRVTLWIERDRTRRPHGLLAEIAPAERRDAERTDTLELAPTAAGLNVRYRAKVRMKDAWLDGWESERVLPEALELEVLPAPERVNDPAGDGLPDALRLALYLPLRPSPLEKEGVDAGG
ncbi:MAG TPA: prepilin-type N-terminal cleavage/methylation domain-containing protein [Longimicrobium sp.]